MTDKYDLQQQETSCLQTTVEDAAEPVFNSGEKKDPSVRALSPYIDEDDFALLEKECGCYDEVTDVPDPTTNQSVILKRQSNPFEKE
jgi:hypothetical protein